MEVPKSYTLLEWSYPSSCAAETDSGDQRMNGDTGMEVSAVVQLLVMTGSRV